MTREKVKKHLKNPFHPSMTVILAGQPIIADHRVCAQLLLARSNLFNPDGRHTAGLGKTLHLLNVNGTPLAVGLAGIEADNIGVGVEFLTDAVEPAKHNASCSASGYVMLGLPEAFL